MRRNFPVIEAIQRRGGYCGPVAVAVWLVVRRCESDCDSFTGRQGDTR
jgi:hypothetical protein